MKPKAAWAAVHKTGNECMAVKFIRLKLCRDERLVPVTIIETTAYKRMVEALRESGANDILKDLGEL